MLPKEYRLQKNVQFRKIYQQGRSLASPLLVLYFLRTKGEFKPRIGFSISRRLGSAVERNRLKRRLRAAIKEYLELLPSGVEIIFIARAPLKNSSFAVIKKNMLYLLRKAALITFGK
ncbi:MAG TPA: ribonuclease P protein component [Clostridia bacterium]|nr:ribonuclease P protein component [Clostridia bacterium]